MTSVGFTATIGSTNLALGRGTTYPWAKMPELFGTPAIRSVDYYRPDRDGEIAGRDLLSARTVVMEVHVNAATEEAAESALHLLTEAFSPTDTDTTLTIDVTGVISYYLVGRPRGCTVALDKRLRGGVIAARCEFKATDPRLYISTPQTTVISLATGGTGLTFNATPDFSFGGGASGGSATLNVAGTVTVPWVGTIAGPVTDPVIENLTQGRILAFTGTVNAGETLVVDSYARSVLLNNTASRFSWLTSASRWFNLDTGANTISFHATSGSGTLTVTYRGAYI